MNTRYLAPRTRAEFLSKNKDNSVIYTFPSIIEK